MTSGWTFREPDVERQAPAPAPTRPCEISIRGSTLYYRDPEDAEALGVVDGQGTLWLKDVPHGE
ncbi:MAG: hypothetical protein OXU42_16220 [Deltaproteobacteria bacterium]|nr:hypothetical protein [Deltaproteobacteria bacterium]